MKEKIAAISILANIILAGGKITIGFISHSSAILAEGIHSFMDIFSSAIGYIGIRISRKPEDQNILMAIINLKFWLVFLLP